MRMKPLTTEEIARVTAGQYVGPPEGKTVEITGVVRDNRQVSAGNLFVCIPGTRADGHDYAPAAFAAGAACCLAERELPDAAGPYVLVDSTLRAIRALAAHYRTLFDIPVIGVIGSVGKTTAKEMTAAVLSRKYVTLKTPENLNNELGVPLTLLGLREEHEAAVIEMGISDFGEMSRLAEMVRPDICVMTAIGYCHLEALGDLHGVLRAKSEVFDFMDAGACAVMNGDDELLAGFTPGVRKVTFGFGPDCDYRAAHVENQGVDGISCEIQTPDSKFVTHIPGFGRHLVLAALAAAAVGRELGVDDAQISAGIAQYGAVGGRSNLVATGYIRIINDCYNANPNSMAAALRALSELAGRKVAILGDMMELGQASEQLHREIGTLAVQQGIDCLICCGPQAESIYKGLIATGEKREAWFFPMKEALLSVLPSLIHAGDNVLVKASHGMHFETLVAELEKLR